MTGRVAAVACRRWLLLLLVLALPCGLAAQEADTGRVVTAPGGSTAGWSALRVSKWATLAATLGAAVYGVSTARTADDRYQSLELECQAAPDRCGLRTPDGSYRDDSLEQQYQTVLRQDRRARTALLASQLGAAVSVALFIIDLRHARAPDDIPYHPQGLEITPRRDGVELKLSLPAR